ncbi:hypothetical protein LUZ60_007410 [Juncus effusus]|nr:hypothetical protein LUZ60_007410 [Juncus effusus]
MLERTNETWWLCVARKKKRKKKLGGCGTDRQFNTVHPFHSVTARARAQNRSIPLFSYPFLPESQFQSHLHRLIFFSLIFVFCSDSAVPDSCWKLGSVLYVEQPFLRRNWRILRRRRKEGEMVFVWLISFFLLIALIGLVIFQIMCLADLEFDYINPYDSASRINKVIIPEFVLQAVLSSLFLFSGHWIMFLFSLPFVYYNYTLYDKKQHLVDVTEIFNHLNREKKRRLIKLGSLVVLLFFSLFWMIWSVLEDY